LEDFQAHLDSKGVQHEVVLDMTKVLPDVFYGLSVRLSDEDDVHHLENSAHVEVRHPDCVTALTDLSDIFIFSLGKTPL
jgi:hypothetical protein